MPKHAKGFTLLEVLLVVAAIAILAGIVIIAINPNKQLGDTRNAQRRVDVNTILNAVYQYSLDTNGTLPAAVNTNATCNAVGNQVCKSGGSCAGITDLSVLTTNEKYVMALPNDPTGSSANGTGYFIAKSANGRVTVCAPSAENSATISIGR